MNYLKQGWLVLLLALAFGAALAGINATLSPIIRQNQQDETYMRIPQLVLGYEVGNPDTNNVTVKGDVVTVTPKAGGAPIALQVFEKTIKTPGNPPAKAYVVLNNDTGQAKGFVIEASGPGFADTIKTLIGVSEDGEMILGVYVLEQKETPGLGNKIASRSWNQQYDNQPLVTQAPDEAGLSQSWATQLTVVKDKAARQAKTDQIDAISGATISSKALTVIVNRAMQQMRTAYGEGQLHVDPDESEAH